jgi:hypothetical protein
MKTVFILATRIGSKSKYIFRTFTRDYDRKKVIDLTDDIEKAKYWETDKDASVFLSTCITNERVYLVETHQVKKQKEKTTQFTDRAIKAMIDPSLH